jgi:hypothetical protein
MSLLLPPSSPDVNGWSLTGYKIGYRARVGVNAATMRVDCAPDEIGHDSGYIASDATISKVSYSIYLSCTECRDFKIPGAEGGALSLCDTLRMPGWNSVVATRDACVINGIECGPGDPRDVGCYATMSGPSRHVYMNNFHVEREESAMPLPGPVPKFRFI